MSTWTHKTLGEFISLQRGYDLTADEQEPGDVPVMGAAGHNGFHSKAKVSAPGIIVGRSGGSFGQVHMAKQDFWPHNTAMYVSDFKGNDVDFVYYFLKNLNFSSFNSGSAQPSLNRNYIYPIKISVPLPTEQKNISAVLCAIDVKIALNNRINAELDAMAKTLYDYWFVQFDFPDENGKPYKSSDGKMEYNPTLKRHIPAGWECLDLSAVIERVATGLNPRQHFALGQGSNYYVTIKSIEDGRILLDDKCDKIDDNTLEIINRRSDLRVGDILFTSIEPVGLTYLIQEKPKNWNINESVFSLRPNYSLISSEYAYLLLSSKEMKAFTKNTSAGSIHKGIRIGVLNTFKFAFGGAELIADFSKLIAPQLKYRFKIEQENQQLTQLRDWLLPMLMNGQVKVVSGMNTTITRAENEKTARRRKG